MARLPTRSLAALLLALGLAPLTPLPAQTPTIAPTIADVAYGTHPKQVLDVYQAKSTDPAPALVFIHGGGWMMGDKAAELPFLQACLDAGITYVSINYRLIPDATADGIKPPVKACLDDSARALQFIRTNAEKWNIDPNRIGVVGGSAGGFSALWLAFHPDLADPKSADPVTRQSTKPLFAFTFVPQTSLDPVQMRQWISNIDYGPHAFELPSYQDFIDQRESLLTEIRDFSPYELASSDDPPVYLFYDSVPAMGEPAKDPPHSANFGAGLVEKLKAEGIEYEFNYPGATDLKYPDLVSFIKAKLQPEK